jgi:hypothetical protein
MLFAANKITHTLMRLQKPAIKPAIGRFRGFIGHFARKVSDFFRVHRSLFKHGNQGRQASNRKASIKHSTRSSSIALRLNCCTPAELASGHLHRRTRSPRSFAVLSVYFFALLISPPRTCIIFCRHARCPRPNALPEFIFTNSAKGPALLSALSFNRPLLQLYFRRLFALRPLSFFCCVYIISRALLEALPSLPRRLHPPSLSAVVFRWRKWRMLILRTEPRSAVQVAGRGSGLRSWTYCSSGKQIGRSHKRSASATAVQPML